MQKIYENLMKAYFKKGKIGTVTPYDIKHAERIAYTVAKRLYKKKVA